jgi:hypothetical protein
LILSSAVATAGSFGSADPSLQPWPARNRRHRPRGVHGVTSDGLHHAFLPLPTEASLASVWSTGTFNIGTTPYVITSRVGEKFVKFKPGTI